MSEYDQKLAAVRAREDEALSELEKLGFRVTLHTLPHFAEEDPLLGTKAGWVNGDCYAVLYDRSGKRKHVSGISAVDALLAAQAWSRWQQGLKDDAAGKFHPTSNDVPETRVVSRVAGDTAETRERVARGVRRIISFQSGTAELVDAHGEAIGDDATSSASQFRGRD